MSTILKALRRLEEEKQKQAAMERLHGEVLSPAPSLAWSRRHRWLLVAGALGAMLLLGAVGYGVLPGWMPTEAEMETETRDVMVLPDPATAARKMPVEPPAESHVRPPDTGTPAVSAPAVASFHRERARPVEAEDVRSSSLSQPAKVERRPPAPLEPSGAPVEESVTRIRRAPVPDISVVSTEWHPTRERRVVHIAVDDGADVLRLHEGDAYAGLVVSEIKLSSVTFDHDGVTISRRVEGRR